ncbi:MAG: alpha/beta fold hydrolase [Nitrospira sp.]|nr:alpha/beta fold hydrolase [Nitrospira sp.]
MTGDQSAVPGHGMEEPVTIRDAQGHRVSAVLSSPVQARGIVVLCHGFLSNKHSTTNKTLTRLLNERGFATFRFDFFGHGESDGRFEDITVSLALGQAKTVVDFVAARSRSPIGLVGSSFGGLVAVLTAADRPVIACLSLKCPVVDFAEELRLEFGVDELARWRDTNMVPDIHGGPNRRRLGYGLYEDSLRQVAYEPATRITAPTLIVQGDRDELVPLHQSRRLMEALRGPKRLDLLPGADHQFSKGEDFLSMTIAIADWLTLHLDPSRV